MSDMEAKLFIGILSFLGGIFTVYVQILLKRDELERKDKEIELKDREIANKQEEVIALRAEARLNRIRDFKKDVYLPLVTLFGEYNKIITHVPLFPSSEASKFEIPKHAIDASYHKDIVACGPIFSAVDAAIRRAIKAIQFVRLGRKRIDELLDEATIRQDQHSFMTVVASEHEKLVSDSMKELREVNALYFNAIQLIRDELGFDKLEDNEVTEHLQGIEDMAGSVAAFHRQMRSQY